MGYIRFENIQGPFGDATCSYDIVTDAITVEDFVDNILNNCTDDNFISVELSNHKKSDVAIAEIGKRNDDKFYIERQCINYDEYKKCKIDYIKANGGWGRMGYRIYTKDDFPLQDRNEFFMVYFGYLPTSH